MQIELDINTEDERWNSYLRGKTTWGQSNLDEIEEIIDETLSWFSNIYALSRVEISILLADDVELQRLNKQFRDKDQPTNVLSFPELNLKPGDILEFSPKGDYIFLGDIAMSYDTIQREAEDRGITFHDHVLHLFVHSLLHLLGFDHTNDQDAERMEHIEIEILSLFGIESPYK